MLSDNVLQFLCILPVGVRLVPCFKGYVAMLAHTQYSWALSNGKNNLSTHDKVGCHPGGEGQLPARWVGAYIFSAFVTCRKMM